MVYLDYSQQELDAQYDVGSPETPERLRQRQWVDEENARVRASFECRLDVPYGEPAAEKLDIFPARRPRSPVLLNIHGGYWKLFDKAEESLYAALLVPAGAAYVACNYTLAPAAGLDEMVRQCRAATAWVTQNAAEFGGDPARIHLIGRSAGAHLAAMVLATDWAGDFGLGASPVAGATLISGLYDLEPIRLCFANQWTRLDAAAAHRLSPIHHLPAMPCPVIVAWGGAETDEFRRQSQIYAEAFQARGTPCTTIEIPGALHSGSRMELADGHSPLTQAVFTQAGLKLET
jgi:arylformamidase